MEDINLRETYNRIAEDWHRDHQSDTWLVEGTDKFISLLKSGDSVLDVGCGGGTKAKHLQARGLRVTGIDFSGKMIEIARREVPAGRFLVLNLYDLSGLAEIFDGIFMQATLIHVPKRDIPGVFHRLMEKLKPAGYLYVSVKEIRPGQPEEATVAERDYGYEYRRFFSYFTLPEVEDHFRQLGLEIVYTNITNITPSGNSRWIQVIGKQ